MIYLHVYESVENSKAFSKKKLFNNLSFYLNKNPKDIVLKRNENGKPYVDGLFFSVSHSQDKIVQAFTTDDEIGIDLEYRQVDRPYLRLAKRYFHEHEYDALVKLSDQQSLSLFYNLWTAKEAVCKAQGGRLWYYLHENYMTSTTQILPLMHAMKLQHLNIIPQFSLCIASNAQTIKVQYD